MPSPILGCLVAALLAMAISIGAPAQARGANGSRVIHPDTAEVLLERDIAGVGIDTLSLDYGASKSFGFHVAMLKEGKYQVENLANLDAMPATGATVLIGVLPVRDGTQAQARIVALLP